MSSSKKPEFQFNLKIDLVNIISFNSNLKEKGAWGSYKKPFDADQFMHLYLDLGKPSCDFNIPQFPGNSIINFTVEPLTPVEEVNDFSVEYMRLTLIGPSEFILNTPRDLWKDILDLKHTDGAVGTNGDFFLSQPGKNGFFKIETSNQLNASSYNIIYEVCFSFSYNGHIKYCLIDPLIKTSSGDRVE